MTDPVLELILNDHGAITVKQAGAYLVELVPTIFNWRLVLTPVHDTSGYDAGWCYFGTDREAFARCYLAAMAFDPGRESDPANFNKALQRRRLPEEPS